MPKSSRQYCLKTPQKSMGFTQKSSCKAQGFIKRTSKQNKGKYVVSPKYKKNNKTKTNKSLYSCGKGKPKTKTGFKNEETALQTLKNIKKYNMIYQIQVVNTMYNRAKYHPSQTNDMKKAMKIYKKFIDSL